MDGGTSEATDGLRDLFDRIERGEGVVITRDGRPVTHAAAGRLRALAIELRSGLPLATLDRALAVAAVGTGVTVLGTITPP